MITHRIGFHSVLLPFLIIYMELWIFLVCMLIKLSIQNFTGGGGDFYVNKWIHVFNSESPIEKMESHAFHYWYFYNLIFNFIRFYYLYGLLFVPRLTILDIGKRWKMVKVLISMTRRVCIIHNVFGLCILHDTNLVLIGSSRYPFEERTLYVKDRLFAS